MITLAINPDAWRANFGIEVDDVNSHYAHMAKADARDVNFLDGLWSNSFDKGGNA